MSTTASSICAFIAQDHQYVIDRRVISSCDFSLFRRNLLKIIKTLNECEANDTTEISNKLRWLLSEWITTPIPFGKDLSEKIKILGKPEEVAMRWPDIKEAYEVSLIAATRLSQNENPIRLEIRHVIDDLIVSGKKFKIYCHKNARQYFESIMHDLSPDLIDGDYFIHKPKDYRRIEPFDVLIKVGPFRSCGWGSCPDALLTAPRFETAIQFVWSGSRDEPGFGLDPVTGVSIIGENSFDLSLPSENGMSRVIPWALKITQTGEFLPIIDEDEFQVFQTINKVDKRTAVLLHIDEQYGILYPFREKILIFNPTADSQNEQIGLHLPGDVSVSGAFLILPIIAPVDFGELHAKDGAYSLIWKKRLSEEIRKDHSGLCKRLFDSGIKLISLFSRIEEWSNPPKTVILAPQKVEHFRILIDHLGIEGHVEGQKQPWWQYAWKEIRRSKGEAISEGRIAQDLLHEHSLKLLISLQEKIHEKTKQETDFYIRLPEGKELQGHFRFCKIVDIEIDFRAPDSAFREINDLREFEQWRG